MDKPVLHNAPQAVEDALRHVQKFYPFITHVAYLWSDIYLYMDDEGEAWPLNDCDKEILHAALKAVEELPSIYYLEAPE